MIDSIYKPTGFSKIPLPKINIFEVGLRDGLQNEKKVLSLGERFELAQKLIESGLSEIELGSFVRADRIPALANTGELVKKVKALKAAAKLWAFIPNQKGFEDGVAAGIDGASFFSSVSDTFCMKNVNRTRDAQKEELAKLLDQSKKAGLKSRVYLSTIVYCPYEGTVSPEKTFKEVKDLFDMGATRVVLSDTTGHANPLSISLLLELCTKAYSPGAFALHLHDTRGLALANACEGIRWGVDEYDSSIAGLGGCPYAPGASGNLATEDLLYCLQSFGLLSELSLDKLTEAARLTESNIGRRGTSKLLRAHKES